MNHANMCSDRLRRVVRAMKDGRWHSTRDIMRRADVCAVNSCIAELRCNGAEIETDIRTVDGRRIWFYRMTTVPPLPPQTRKSAS